MKNKKISSRRLIKSLANQLRIVRELRVLDQKKIDELERQLKSERDSRLTKQALVNGLANIIDANAQLTQFAARILEPGTF